METLEIAAGLKKRPLSRLEVQAQLVVEQYASVAIETRQAWRSIRKTHPGVRAKTHPEWENFESLRDQRGVLADQIMQNPVLYRPFLKETHASLVGKAFEKDGRNENFGYGMHIIKAQAEAHQSKILQKEMLKDKTDPVLSEKLQTLLAYVEARDLSAFLWTDLKPKLKQAEGTLLSDAFCKDIDAWKESRMARDQHALKIVDAWEDYAPLIQKIGMKLSFDKLCDQKGQAVRDTLFNTYKTSQEEGAKLQAAFEIKALMDDEATTGKKLTVAQVYQQGLQPKDITQHAQAWQKLKILETLSSEAEKVPFRLYSTYDDHAIIAKGIYRQCVDDTSVSDTSISDTRVGDTSVSDTRIQDQASLGTRLSESKHFSAYQEAVFERNAIALELSKHPGFLRCLDLVERHGLSTNREAIISHAEDGYREKMLSQYKELVQSPDTKSEILKVKLAGHLTKMIQDDQVDGHKKTLAAIYQAQLNPKDIFAGANDFKDYVQFSALETEEERHLFGSVYAYKVASTRADGHYRSCCQEAEQQNLKKTETASYLLFQEALKERQKIASVIEQTGKPNLFASIAEDMGVSIEKLSKDRQAYDRGQSLKLKEEETQAKGKPILPVPENVHPLPELEQEKDPQTPERSKLTVAKAAPSSRHQKSKVDHRPSVDSVKRQDKHYSKHYSAQEAETLDYLKDEITPQKYRWLAGSERLCQRLLDLAETKPLAALKEWQEISEDYSFRSSSSEAQMTSEQKGVKQKVLNYLHAIDTNAKQYEDVYKEDYLSILQVAKKDPLKALQQWHKVSNDYSFNPFRDKLSDKEIHLQDYMLQKLEKEGQGFSEEKYAALTEQLLDNPLKTYQNWHLYGDKIFDPISGISKAEDEAQSLMAQVKDHVSPDVFKHWQETINTSPETVIKECRDLIESNRQNAKVETAAKEFISLSEHYEKTPWGDSKKSKISEALTQLSATYWKNEKFLAVIESSESKAASIRIRQDIESLQREQSRSRGVDM